MSPQPIDPSGQQLDARFGRAWRDHRRYVLDVGFRMLGNLAEAEDVVQEAFARLLRTDIDELEDVRGWLVVVVSRLCLDRLRAERRHPTAPGLLPEGLSALTDTDPADRITLDDNVRLALNLVLERLTPAERTALVLHDVFQYSFDEVGEIVGRSAVACRQLASRARQRIRSEVGPSRFTVEPAEQREVTERFIAACSRGDVEGLLAVLDPNVAGDVELGPTMPQPPAIVGARNVAESILRFFGPQTAATLLALPAEGGAALVAFARDRIGALISLTLYEGKVVHIHALVDPVKLAPIAQELGGQPFPEVIPPDQW